MKMRALFWRSPSRPASKPQAEADRWVARRVLGLSSPDEDLALSQWLETGENRAAFRESEAAYLNAGAYESDEGVEDLRAEVRATRAPSRGRLAGVVLAVAASLLVVAGVWGGAERFAAPTRAVQSAQMVQTKRYETAIGERRRVILDDGSVVTLNTGSVLEVAFTAARRDLRLLDGQALFEVAHDRNWPFVVTAGDRRIQAVGTVFDVRLDGAAVKVVLVDGKVRIDRLKRPPLERILPGLADDELQAGEQLLAHLGEREARVMAADLQREESWRTGRVVFRDDTLAVAAAELNRYSSQHIVVSDPAVSALRISGVFSLDRPENFAAAVASFYGLRVSRPGSDVIELSRDRSGG